MKLVLDTNVAVSGLLWRGNCNLILKQIRDGRHVLLLSDDIIDELKRVLQYQKFKSRIKRLRSKPEEIIAYYQNLGRFIPVREHLKIRLRDPGDKIFLELAHYGRPHLIITGDGHLLQLNTFEKIPIVMPSEALQVFERR